MKGLNEKDLITVILALEDAIDMCELNIASCETMTKARNLQRSVKEYQDLHDKLKNKKV